MSQCQDGRVRIDVVNAAESLPKLFELAQKKKIKVLEVTYHRPTLNDVFLYLTGRELREESGESSMKSMMRRRLRR